MAGKAARARKHMKKMAEKRRKKAEKRARYAAMAGTSRKKKKVVQFNKKRRKFNAYKHAHRIANCGNPGCKRCGLVKEVKSA